MNQILYKCTFDFSNPSKKQKNKYIIIFVIAIILIIVATFFYFFSKYIKFQNEKLSKNLMSIYNIKTLYSNSPNEYSTKKVIAEAPSKTTDPFVIGLIQIEKIKLIYPILSTTTPELLKISPCRFAGPMPNEIGNLCIAGHNYVDNKLFSKIHLLEKDDLIRIYDINGNDIDYIVYSKEEINSSELSCIDQDTNGKRQITLITCNNVTGNRICIKALENK